MRRLIIIIVCFIAALGTVLIFVRPEYQKLQEFKKTIEFKQNELASKAEYYSAVQKIAADLESYQAELNKISSSFPAEPFLPALFYYLGQKASQSGLILEKIEFGGTEEISISLQLTGSYSSLKNFLLAIEKSVKLIQVQNISFSAPGDSQKLFSFNLNIQTHSY